MLSVYYIIRNAIRFFPMAVETALKNADQIVIVDTGSRDGTREYLDYLSRKPKVEIYDFKWADDFSAARNYVLQFCKEKWILQLDADEFITEADYLLIKRDVLAHGAADSFTLQINNYLQEPFFNPRPHILYGRAVRIFKNRKDIKYTGIIHEKLNVKKTIDLPYPIHHLQYFEQKNIVKKMRYYEQLIDKKIGDEQPTALDYVHRADIGRRLYMWTGKTEHLEQAIGNLKQSLKLENNNRVRATLIELQAILNRERIRNEQQKVN